MHYEIPKERIMSESHNDAGCDVAANGNYHLGLVSDALGRVLSAAGVLGPGAALTGPELLAAAEHYIEHLSAAKREMQDQVDTHINALSDTR